MLNNQLQAPSKIPKDIKQIKESAAPPAMAGVSGMEGMGGGTAGGVMGGILGGIGSGPRCQGSAPKKLSISSGVMAGNLLEKITPQYPAIAKAARIQGTVVLQATISKTVRSRTSESSVVLLCCSNRPWMPSAPGATSHICSMETPSKSKLRST